MTDEEAFEAYLKAFPLARSGRTVEGRLNHLFERGASCGDIPWSLCHDAQYATYESVFPCKRCAAKARTALKKLEAKDG